jgi:hypothetical protein
MDKDINVLAQGYFDDLESDGRNDTPENLRAWLWFTCPAILRQEVEAKINQMKAEKPGLLQIENDGPDIRATNYWDSEHAERGYFYLSLNSGCVRLLVPDAKVAEIQEFRTAKYAILSRGPWPEMGRDDALELLFEDFSDSPYALQLSIEQCDMLPDGKGSWTLAVWSRAGKQYECELKYRHVDQIPCLKPWEEG